jgi:hypothetical protein
VADEYDERRDDREPEVQVLTQRNGREVAEQPIAKHAAAEAATGCRTACPNVSIAKRDDI